MGSGSQAKAERRRRALASTSSNPDRLRLVVATLPGNREALEDLRLVRSALLYADVVELYSPLVTLIDSVAGGRSRDPADMLRFFLSCGDTMITSLGLGDHPDEARQNLRRMLTVTTLPRATVRASKTHRETRDEVRRQLSDIPELDELLTSWGAEELHEAIDEGALTLNDVHIDLDDDLDVLTDRFAALLSKLLTCPSRHVLLDDTMSDLAGSLVKEGHLSPSDLAIDRTSRSRLGTGLINRLPAFPDAPMESILEARRELAPTRSRYREHMTVLNERLMSGPLDPDRASEIADLWRDTVDPALQDLKRDLSRTRLARQAGLEAAADTKTWLAAVGGSSLITVVGANDLWKGPIIAAAGGAAVAATARALISNSPRREQATTHGLYYLVQLQKQLEK